MNCIDFVHDVADVFYSDFGNYDLNVVFYLTRHCNLACPDCYMHASPDVPENQMPVDDIKFYLAELKSLPNFIPAVAFSGGEVFTLPLEYLRENIENAFAENLAVELKSNGAWGADSQSRKDVFDMVRGLNIPEHMCAPNADAFEYVVSQKMKWLDKKRFRAYRLLHDKQRTYKYFLELSKHKYNVDVMASPLTITLSVDNVVHSGESVDWCNNIVHDIVRDNDLRRKISLCCMNLDENLKQRVKTYFMDGYPCTVISGGCKINPNSDNYFDGDWIDKPQYNNGKLVQRGCMNLFFWPDGTVALDSNLNCQPVGRVPYKNKNGEYKDIKTIMDNIATKIVRDYEQQNR